tara:strand:- start:330 stop:2639 length:2310 start_codon:yes stop_codon:yes gene_type:complete
MKHHLLTLIVSVLAVTGFATLGFAAERPNILYFYVDDMGWGSIGPNAQAARRAKGLPTVQTPNLDQLAAEGINFSRGYGCTVCSPARSSQQTGFHQGHTFADRNDPDNAKKAIRTDDITMGDALSDAGYVTGYWGKWGYGGSKDLVTDPTIDNLQTLPTSHGYQHVLTELHHVRAHTFFQPTLWAAPAPKGSEGGLYLAPNSLAEIAGQKQYPDQPAWQNHEDYPEIAYCDDSYCFAALDFVRENAMNYRKDGTPFFGLLAVQIPHAPFDEVATLPEWDQAYAEDNHFSELKDQSKEWAAMVTRIDAHFGNILAALDDPNGDGDTSDSVADDTLVIFMSDNGGPGGPNNEEFDANGGLKGNKGSINEGGIRVPTIMRWPAKITKKSGLKIGTISDLVMDVTDLLPTFCDLAGAPTPLGLDGVSLAPLLLDSGERRPREFLIHEAKGQSIIRGDHKLIQIAGKVKGKKGAVGPKRYELYDLAEDPGETTDLSSKFPDLVEGLKTVLVAERVDEPRGFANTYHHWIGQNGATTSNADCWSDYEYANAGVSYLTDTGAPRLSWTALIENATKKDRSAEADKDTEFLALEIRGGKKATQTLAVGKGVTVTGRNEVRISEGGVLDVQAGKVASIRWIDVKPGGILKGAGSVEGILYNGGTVAVTPVAGTDGMAVSGDYRESEGAALAVAVNCDSVGNIQVAGRAFLAGDLAVISEVPLKAGQRFSLVTASEVHGQFANSGDQVIASDGSILSIHYTEFGVELVVEDPLRLTSSN